MNVATDAASTIGANQVLSSEAFGAFLGAFSAFLFGLLAYEYTKKRERWSKHHNALVKTEHLVNRHLNGITGNIYLLKGALDTYSKGGFSYNVLSPLDNPDYMIDFHNLELSNTYLNYQTLLDKVNHDLQSWNRANDTIFSVAISGNVDPASIAFNKNILTQQTKLMVRHLEDLLALTYTTGAYVRKFMQVDKRDIFARLGPTSRIKLTISQVKAEREKFVKESEETMEKDKKERTSKYGDTDSATNSKNTT